MKHDDRAGDGEPIPAALREALRIAAPDWAATHDTGPLRGRILRAVRQAGHVARGRGSWWSYAAGWARPVIPFGIAAAMLLAAFDIVGVVRGRADEERNDVVLRLVLGDELVTDDIVGHVVAPDDRQLQGDGR